MKNHLISRRSVLAGTAAAGALSLTGFPARAEVNWKKYAGTKLEVILAKGPRGDNFQKNIKEFTDLTGIQVESEQIPEQQQRQKAVIELASGKPSFDVIHVSYHVQKRQFEKGGWLADISGFMKDPNLTAPDLVESDFSAAGLQYAKNDKGQMLSLPWSVDYFILYYNKELFEKKGVAVPKTFDEMLAAAEKLTDAKEGTFGFVGRGLRNANMTLWTNFFLNYRRRIPRQERRHPDRRSGGDRSHQAVPDTADQGSTSRRRRLQLDGVDGVLHARPLGDVDRRRRLGAAAGRSGRLAHRRQGRLHRRADGIEGPVFGDLWRRSRHRGRQQEQGGCLSAASMGGLQEAGRAAVAVRRRRAVPQLHPQRPGDPERA